MSSDELDGQDPWGQLLRPWAATRWFAANPRPALAPEVESFSAANGWWLAQLSRLVYRNAHRAPVLAGAGLHEVAFVSRGGTQCLIVVPEGPEPAAALCAFRGTDEARDWWSNLQVTPTAWPDGGRVHKGFRDAFDDAWEAIETTLDRLQLPELIGGHSLGGALALLAASRRRPVGCYAFGAPHVGDGEFAATLADVPAFRLVHGKDLVPSLPPSSPLLRFAPAGEEIALESVAGDRSWNGPPTQLVDHAPSRYIEALRRRLTAT